MIMNGNNVFGTQLGALNVTINPEATPPAADYTKIEFPTLGGVYFCPASKDYGTQSFLLYDAQDGSGQYAQFGTFTQPMKNWGLVCDISANENFQVYDSTGKMLFAVTGDGTTKLNKISRQGAAPTVVGTAALGSTGSVAVVAGGTDTAFQVAAVANGTGITGGTMFTVTFATAFLKHPIIVFALEGNAQQNMLVAEVGAVTTNGFLFFMPGAACAANPATQLINFIVIG